MAGERDKNQQRHHFSKKRKLLSIGRELDQILEDEFQSSTSAVVPHATQVTEPDQIDDLNIDQTSFQMKKSSLQPLHKKSNSMNIRHDHNKTLSSFQKHGTL